MDFINLIKGVIKKMFNKSNIQSALNVEVAVSDRLQSEINKWSRIYENKAPWLNENVKSLELASAISNEFVRLTMAELESNITGSARATFLQKQYEKVLKELPNNLEFGNAKGGLIIKPYVKSGSIYIDFVQQGYFAPTSYDDTGKIIGAVFLSQKTQGADIFTRLEYHKFEGTDYYIINKVFKSRDKNSLGKEVSLLSVPEWSDIEPQTKIENIEKPLFAYYKPPIANNIDTKSPLGVSVFSKAVNLIKDADEQYGRAMWEYEASEKAIFASIDVLKPKKELIKDGTATRTVWQTPTLKDRLFKGLDMSTKEGDDLLKDYSPEIRDEAFWRGLNKILERIEFNCCLAYGTLSEPTYSDKTATEIKSSKQRSYTTVSRMQENLQNSLEDLLYAMDVLTTLYELAPVGNYEASFTWGDSILTDTQTETTLQMQEVNAGLRSKLKYIMYRYGLTEEQALEELARIEEEKRK